MGVPEGEEVDKDRENIFNKRMAETFSSLGRDIGFWTHEAQKTPLRCHPKVLPKAHYNQAVKS